MIGRAVLQGLWALLGRLEIALSDTLSAQAAAPGVTRSPSRRISRSGNNSFVQRSKAPGLGKPPCPGPASPQMYPHAFHSRAPLPSGQTSPVHYRAKTAMTHYQCCRCPQMINSCPQPGKTPLCRCEVSAIGVTCRDNDAQGPGRGWTRQHH